MGFSSEGTWSLPTLISFCWGDEQPQTFRAYDNDMHFLLPSLWIAVLQPGSALDCGSESDCSMYLLFQVTLQKEQPSEHALLVDTRGTQESKHEATFTASLNHAID